MKRRCNGARSLLTEQREGTLARTDAQADGYTMDGESARAVVGEVAVLLAFAAIFLALGTRLLHRQLTLT